jgi:hypothetical protein
MFSGVSEIEVKMAERAWEAAVLPLNYARELFGKIRSFSLFSARFWSRTIVSS